MRSEVLPIVPKEEAERWCEKATEPNEANRLRLQPIDSSGASERPTDRLFCRPMSIFATINHWLHLTAVVFWLGGVAFQVSSSPRF